MKNCLRSLAEKDNYMSQHNDNKAPACATCKVEKLKRICRSPENEAAGKNCPTVLQREALEAANALYDDPQTREFARQASLQEASCYADRHERPFVPRPSKPRVEEIWEFAGRMGYQKLGLAFCEGLLKEAAMVARLFEDRGFEVISAVCKAGATPKEFLGLADEDKILQGEFESVCNPVYQAELLNRSGTEFNILLGLCVGHDSLFLQHAQAPSTVLAVKDRVTGHNPLAAVYCSESYYRRLQVPPAAKDQKKNQREALASLSRWMRSCRSLMAREMLLSRGWNTKKAFRSFRASPSLPIFSQAWERMQWASPMAGSSLMVALKSSGQAGYRP
eukprot:TRINITY_DN2888_c0_g7_i1.p2 TRINITY_DN2888_c0_g7~~TRINITY_DN2888_c0_g7_i1.p2  ORF type:complete len:334 (+),score=100.06 TRINITY_DN2888_c0_g7_i1:773-1774(+)